MLLIAIDLGKTGAIACSYGGEVCVEDIPTNDDGYDLAAIVAQLRDTIGDTRPVMVVMEKVHAMNKGTIASFSMGYALGMFRGICEALDVKVHLVSPVKWKKAMKLSADKQQSLDMARELFPQLVPDLKLKKHHNRAEALLLLKYIEKFGE